MEWIYVLMLLPFLILLLVSESGHRATAQRQARRLAAVERKLGLIMDHLGIHEPEPDGPLQELAAGRKLQAIKMYREATGAGLKDAKDAVEQLAKRHGLQ